MRLLKAVSLAAFMAVFLCVSAQAQRTATATPTVVNGFLVAITVTDGGAGYTNAPGVTISGGGGSGATATATVLNGAVDKVIVGNAGNGYTGTPSVVIAPPPSPKPPFSDGLVAYYPFNGNANDASGNGNNGTSMNVNFVPDRFSSGSEAASFASGNAFVECPTLRGLPYFPVTYSLWFKLDSYPINPELGNTMTLIGRDKGGYSGEGALVLINGFADGQTNELIYITGGEIPTHRTPVTGKWTHLVFTFDNSRVATFYLGGQLVRSQVYTLPQDADLPFRIGASADWLGNRLSWNGAIDDVRIYNRALSAQEVKDLYKYEAPVQPFSDGLVAYYPFNGNANDESGNGNDGQISGNVFSAKDRFGNTSSAYQFEPSFGYIDVTKPVFNIGQTGYTISVWFCSDDVDRLSQCIFNTIPHTGIGMGLNGGDIRRPVAYNVGTANGSWTQNINGTRSDYVNGVWYHFVVTKNGTDYTLFVNGQVDAAKTVPGAATFDNNVAFRLGDLSLGPDYTGRQVFPGRLDDFRIYNRALSGQEVKDLYRYEAPEGPSLTMEVQTVRVTMKVRPTRKYQLEASLDLSTWTKQGEPFVASSSEVVQQFNAIETGRFFRIYEVQ